MPRKLTWQKHKEFEKMWFIFRMTSKQTLEEKSGHGRAVSQ